MANSHRRIGELDRIDTLNLLERSKSLITRSDELMLTSQQAIALTNASLSARTLQLTHYRPLVYRAIDP